jgi:hypothetical protein
MNSGPIIPSNINDILESIRKESLWFENNERFVIVEKFESDKCVITNSNIYNHKQIFQFFNQNNELHRNNGNPSFISSHMFMWHKNGNIHRNNGKPAIIRSINNYGFGRIHGERTPIEEYFINGQRHRDGDLPAVIFENPNTHLLWFKNGALHRDKNMPSIINGNFLYYYNNNILYKSEIKYNNKLVDWIFKHPFILVVIIFSVSIIITSCF